MLVWESLQLGLGRDMVPSFIFRTLSPHLCSYPYSDTTRFRCYLALCIVSFVLDSVSHCIYVLLWVPSRIVVILSQLHPHNVCVATCTLCLVAVLGSLLCGFGGNRSNLNSTDLGGIIVRSQPHGRMKGTSEPQIRHLACQVGG